MFPAYLSVFWLIASTGIEDVHSKIQASSLTKQFIFQDFGTISLSHKSWLVFNIQNLDDIKSLIKQMKQHMYDVGKTTKKLDKKGFNFIKNWTSSNTEILNSLSKRIATSRSIVLDLEELHGTYPNHMQRPKRYAPLGIVGSLLRYVGGVATLDDIDQLEQKINEILVSQNNLYHVQMQAISVINDSVTDTYKNSLAINNVIEKLSNISGDINTLHSELLEVDSRVTRLSITTRLDSFIRELFSAAAYLEEKLAEKQSTLMNALNGHIDIKSIPIHKLVSILEEIQRSLPRTEELAISISTPLRYYDERLVRVVADGDNVAFLIFIPLRDVNLEFNLIRAIPVPFISDSDGELYAMIKPEFEYFATSPTRR